jgi:hypothetical protein
MSGKTKDDDYSANELQKRFEAALKSAMSTPHKPLKEKPKAKKAKKAANKKSKQPKKTV